MSMAALHAENSRHWKWISEQMTLVMALCSSTHMMHPNIHAARWLFLGVASAAKLSPVTFKSNHQALMTKRLYNSIVKEFPMYTI